MIVIGKATPEEKEDIYSESLPRTGEKGEKGVCITAYCKKVETLVSSRADLSKPRKQVVARPAAALWRAASPGAGGTGRSAARQAPGERRPSVARASVDCRMSGPVPTSRPRTLTALWVTAASAGRPGRGAASPDAAKCRDVG